MKQKLSLLAFALMGILSAPVLASPLHQTASIDTPPLTASDAPADTVWLDSLDLTKMTSGWKKPLAGKSIEGGPILLKGITYPHGVGTHAHSEVGVDLGGNAKRFLAVIGVDDDSEEKGTVNFQVWVDGKKRVDAYQTGKDRAPQQISVDLRGAKQMVLIVTNADGNDAFDHADWAGAMIEMVPGTTTPFAMISAPPVDITTDDAPMPIFSYATPEAKPAIHGARVVGGTPGRPFLFLVPATGVQPLKFSARGLPKGLSIDPKTGIISGTIQKAETKVATITVSGPKGKASRKLTIMGGERMLARTPPMGWNTWNLYHGGDDDGKIRQAAMAMIDSGLAAHGYQYINIDDCWEATRDSRGVLATNEKYPNMRVLGDFIHSKGLKFGIYSSPGPKTCANFEGSYLHEEIDALSYASWGVDFLKYDYCSYGNVVDSVNLVTLQKPYAVMRAALDKVPRDIVYSLCEYGSGDVWNWGADPTIAGNLWRTTGDIGPSYASMSSIGFHQDRPGQAEHAGPGHWNDPDMLWLHAMKPNEQVTHMTLWSLLAAPLIIGSDLAHLDPYTRDILSNDEVIEIDQDPLGKQATRLTKEGDMEVWTRPLWDGTIAVGLFNRSVDHAMVSVRWSDLKINGKQPVRDLWRHVDLGKFADSFSIDVPGHGAALVKIGKPTKKE